MKEKQSELVRKLAEDLYRNLGEVEPPDTDERAIRLINLELSNWFLENEIRLQSISGIRTNKTND